MSEVERVDVAGRRFYRIRNLPFLLPSVTTVLSSTKPVEATEALEAWRARVGHAEADKIGQAAADRGTTLHARMEAWLNSRGYTWDPDEPTGDPWWDSLRSVRMSITDHLLVEKYVWCILPNGRGFAGTLDACIVLRSGAVTVTDWKTSRGPLYPDKLADYRIQAAAYTYAARARGLLPARPLPQAMIAAAHPDRSASVDVIAGPRLAEAWKAFCLRLDRFYENHVDE